MSELYHYGVRGMKWDSSKRKSSMYSINRTAVQPNQNDSEASKGRMSLRSYINNYRDNKVRNRENFDIKMRKIKNQKEKNHAELVEKLKKMKNEHDVNIKKRQMETLHNMLEANPKARRFYKERFKKK